MENKNIRKTIPEPLMFIHTVSTPICSNGSRQCYDSRDDKGLKKIIKPIKEKKGIDDLLKQKINNIVQMYQISNGIPCLIETKNNESIEGIPYKLIDGNLAIKQDDNTIFVSLEDIKDIVILKI